MSNPYRAKAKPVEVAVWHLSSAIELEPCAAWVRANGQQMRVGNVGGKPTFAMLHEVGGVTRAEVGDYVVADEKGEFRVVREREYAAKYETA